MLYAEDIKRVVDLVDHIKAGRLPVPSILADILAELIDIAQDTDNVYTADLPKE